MWALRICNVPSVSTAKVSCRNHPPPTPSPGMTENERDLGSGSRSRWMGGGGLLPKRLGAVSVGYKSH